VFQSLAQLHVGDERTILFWRDKWINGRKVEDIAPEIAALVPNRRRSTRKVADALLNNSWISDMTGDPSVEGWVQSIKLWEEIDLVETYANVPDMISWK
jgi:hypothetical protein